MHEYIVLVCLKYQIHFQQKRQINAELSVAGGTAVNQVIAAAGGVVSRRGGTLSDRMRGVVRPPV